MIPLTEDEITDRALDALLATKAAGLRYAVCPGCELLVHHSDDNEHSRSCEKLRPLVSSEA